MAQQAAAVKGRAKQSGPASSTTTTQSDKTRPICGNPFDLINYPHMAPIIFDGGAVKIVCISDTHNDDCTAHVPPGDILLHAGDFTDNGTLEELEKAYSWISQLPHKVKVVVAGKDLAMS
jgi:hypothetical protein